MITYERVLVTPQLAKTWLRSNAENNRNPKVGKIPMYARDMLAGDWNSDTGETIKFDEGGTLIDGQNRLMAVAEAGIPIYFDVARGLPRAAMAVIDTGAARTASDVLKIEGATDRLRVAAVVRWVLMWESKMPLGKSVGPGSTPTNTEVLRRFQKDPDVFHAATARGTDCARAGLGQGRVAGVACYLFTGIHAEQAHAFFDQLVSGVGLPAGSPVLALRNRMTRMRVDRLRPEESLALYVRAWNAVREERTITGNLVISHTGKLTNADFPQPK